MRLGLIPFWPLALCYVLQTVGELCLSPIGLSMVTKLAPPRLVGLAMGGWFLSLAVGGNLSGLLAGHISGDSGMTAASALSGFTFSFWLLAGVRRAAVADLAADQPADARRALIQACPAEGGPWVALPHFACDFSAGSTRRAAVHLTRAAVSGYTFRKNLLIRT